MSCCCFRSSGDPERTGYGFSADKRRFLLVGGRETVTMGGSKEMCKAMRNRIILLLPVKLPGFGCEMLPRSFNAHTHTDKHAHYRIIMIKSDNGGGNNCNDKSNGSSPPSSSLCSSVLLSISLTRTHVHTNTFLHTHIHTHIHARTHAQTHPYTHAHTYASTHTHTHTHARAYSSSSPSVNFPYPCPYPYFYDIE